MSQFAAHEKAGRPAASRTAELTPASGLMPKRGTAQSFRELQQRLKSRVPPPPRIAPEPETRPGTEHENAPEPLGDPNQPSAPPEAQELETEPHAFDLSALAGSGNPPLMVDLSGIDRQPAGHLLLEGTISSETLASSEQLEAPAQLQAVPAPQAHQTETGLQGPTAAKLAELKQLRLPSVPEVDEFALVDKSPAPAEIEPATPEPESLSGSLDPPAADPEPRAFWQKSDPGQDAAAEVEAPVPPVNIESEEAGDVARSLLEIMSLPANTTQPQERALAADSLLHLIDRLPLKTLIAMVERLSLMEAPPPLILAELIHDERIEVAGPLLEKCSAITDQDLLTVIADGRQHSNRMIARRRNLASVICDALIATEDASAILTLVRNPGAVVSHEAFFKLNEIARRNPSLQAPLATRADLPAPVAFELFWVLPAQLRRYVISRFLTDSSTLNKILKLNQQLDEPDASPRFASSEEIDRLFGLLTGGDRPAAEELISARLGIAPSTVQRILADVYGEPLAVALKALGASRADFERLLTGLKEASADALRLPTVDLKSFFETLSFNKARVLLTYWDWAVLRSGPYVGL